MTNALLHARAPGTAALLTIRPARAPPPNTDGTVGTGVNTERTGQRRS